MSVVRICETHDPIFDLENAVAVIIGITWFLELWLFVYKPSSPVDSMLLQEKG